MSIIYTDDKSVKPIRSKLTQRNNKIETNLAFQQSHYQQQQSSHSISPTKVINNSNEIYSNADSINANSTGYRVQQYQQYQNKNNTNLKHMQQHQETDGMSLGSLNMPLDEIPHKSRRSEAPHNTQRRTSFLRKHWQQHSDVPFVIGADVAAPNDGMCEKILLGFAWFLLVIFFPISLFFCMKVVQEYERAVIFRLGRLVPGGAKGPGMFLVLPCIETYTKVDMRTVSFDVPPQEVLTKDSVTVAVDAVVYYRVFNPVISIANVENAQESTRLLAQTSLRNVLGTNSLAEILSNREAVSLCMREILDEATGKEFKENPGIKVERVEIKDVRLPIQLQRAMAAEAEATREARAKVIAAEGEHKASRALKDAADILSESSSAIQLRYLQTLNNIAGEKNSTIIFPLPIEIFSGFLNNIKRPKENQQHHHHIAESSNVSSKINSYKFNNNDATDL